MSTTYIFLDATPVDRTLAQNKREAWMPKGDVAYFDKAARQRFESRRQKRAWLTQHGMREAGELLNPRKALGANEGSTMKFNRRNPHDV